MYILTVNHHTMSYSSPIIAASAMAYMGDGVSSLQRFIDILQNMESGEMFIGTNFIVHCFDKEYKENKNAEN